MFPLYSGAQAGNLQDRGRGHYWDGAKQFKYDDYRETNEKFSQLSKYLFKWATGNASVTGEQTKTKVDSQGNMKKLANAIEAGLSHAAVNGTAEYQECLPPERAEAGKSEACPRRGGAEAVRGLARRAKSDTVVGR